VQVEVEWTLTDVDLQCSVCTALSCIVGGRVLRLLIEVGAETLVVQGGAGREGCADILVVQETLLHSPTDSVGAGHHLREETLAFLRSCVLVALVELVGGLHTELGRNVLGVGLVHLVKVTVVAEANGAAHCTDVAHAA